MILKSICINWFWSKSMETKVKCLGNTIIELFQSRLLVCGLSHKVFLKSIELWNVAWPARPRARDRPLGRRRIFFIALNDATRDRSCQLRFGCISCCTSRKWSADRIYIEADQCHNFIMRRHINLLCIPANKSLRSSDNTGIWFSFGYADLAAAWEHMQCFFFKGLVK